LRALNKLKKYLRHFKFIRTAHQLVAPLGHFFAFRPIHLIKSYLLFFKEYKLLKKMIRPDHGVYSWLFYPCLFDKTLQTPVDATYFYQDTWAAKKIFEIKPRHHFDIGSSVKTVGIISQFVPTTMIDIRPFNLDLENLSFQKGSILELPFPDKSVESLSSLCVVEHIGLGRYGDPLDFWGSEKAIAEIKRVLKPGGICLLSVPIDQDNIIYFNAHRAFTRDYFLSLFTEDLELMEERYIYGTELLHDYIPERGFGTGLYMLRKER
jgi:hypothetical protein